MENEKKDCKLKGTEICAFAGSEGCQRCFVGLGHVKEEDLETLNANWLVTKSNLPKGIDRLHCSPQCQFCKGDHPEKKDGYALVDFAHPEPEHKNRMLFGMGKKIRSNIGSMIELPIGICKHCRRRYRLRGMLQWVILGLFLLLALLSLVLPNVAGALAKKAAWLPIVVAAGFLFLGFVLSSACAKLYEAAMEKKTVLHVYEIPLVQEMLEKGWFALQMESGRPRLNFRKRKTKENLRYHPEEPLESAKKD